MMNLAAIVQSVFDEGGSIRAAVRASGLSDTRINAMIADGTVTPNDEVVTRSASGRARFGSESDRDAYTASRIAAIQAMHDATGRTLRQCALELHICRDVARRWLADGLLVNRITHTPAPVRGARVPTDTLPQPPEERPRRAVQSVDEFLASGGKITRLPSVLAVDCPQATVPKQDLDAMKAIYAEREKTAKQERNTSGWKLKKIIAQRVAIHAQAVKNRSY